MVMQAGRDAALYEQAGLLTPRTVMAHGVCPGRGGAASAGREGHRDRALPTQQRLLCRRPAGRAALPAAGR